jgi:two-component sensor histidine kinase
LCPNLTANTALCLGLINAELFANSIKCAHPTGAPTFIKVACRDEQDLFEDDGHRLSRALRPGT